MTGVYTCLGSYKIMAEAVHAHAIVEQHFNVGVCGSSGTGTRLARQTRKCRRYNLREPPRRERLVSGGRRAAAARITTGGARPIWRAMVLSLHLAI